MKIKNPHMHNGDLTTVHDDVKQLAKLFNHPDPHYRRAMFQHACRFVGLPDELETPVRLYLLNAGTEELKSGLASGILRWARDIVGGRVIWTGGAHEGAKGGN